MSMKQLEVQIMGQSYLLGCPEGGEERLRAAVARVHDTMTRIRDAGKVRARDRIAVLAALNLAFDVSDRPAGAAAAAAPAASSAAGPDDSRWADLVQRLDDALQDDAGRAL